MLSLSMNHLKSQKSHNTEIPLPPPPRPDVFQIQKCGRGLMGRRRASAVREERRRRRAAVVVQAAWRGALGRRRAGEVKRKAEATRVCMDGTIPPPARR